MKILFNISKKRPVRICENCKHDHIAETGDCNKYDKSFYELLPMCCYCNCERYKNKKGVELR